MAKQEPQPITGLSVVVLQEEGLVRVGLSGEASIRNVQQIRLARAHFETSTLPILVVDDGLTYIDTVVYGALAQWAHQTRNRSVCWVMATSGGGAGRMFQMAGFNPADVLYPSEEEARKALDRGRPGQRVSVPSRGALALEGLRPK